MFGQEWASQWLHISVPMIANMRKGGKMSGAWKQVNSEEKTCKALLKQWMLTSNG